MESDSGGPGRAGADPGSGTPAVGDGPDLVAARMQAVNARAVVLAGTAAFALAFAVLLPFWSWLGEHDHRVWLWTSLAGAALGLLSLPLVDRHRRQGRQG